MTGFHDTYDNQKDYGEKFAGRDSGPYMGIVKSVADPTRQGRLGVNIPALSNTDSPNVDQLTWCQYLSPFYGAKSLEATSKNDANDYRSTQHSYGFWAIPPDIDTEVLVIFAKGEFDVRQAFWIGCIQQPLVNQQVPGYGSSRFNIRGQQDNRELARSGQRNYGTDFLPVGEKNRRLIENAQTDAFANSVRYPINDITAQQLLDQGLIKDDIRGTTSSSARRETPSNVFGMSTPGRIRPDSRTLNIGVEDAPIRPDRNPGHSFVMDDGDVNGNNQLTRLKTASGHQILMHDTQGVVYIANGSGNSWIEMSGDGKIYIYAQDGFNLRSDGNFDLHSGGDINFHAKENIKFTAEKELVNNANFVFNVGESGVFTSSQKGSVATYGETGITSFSGGQQLHGASGRIDLSGTQVHFNSVPASSQWGPTWLDAQGAGIVFDESQNDVNLTVGKGEVLEVGTKATKTTVPNLVTHEPFTRAPSAIYESVSQWTDPVKWAKLSKTPGTLEFMAQKNRESDNEYVKQLQFFADQKKYLTDQNLLEVKGKDLNFPNEIYNAATKFKSAELQKLSDNFTSTYNKIYNVQTVVKNLATADIKGILTQKVVGGSITSVSSTITKSILGRTSGNNLPPSLRGTATGAITQVASAVSNGISRAIGKIKFW